MTDRVYPSAKPTTNGNGAATVNPSFPATKAQLYGATRPTYRPQPHHRRTRRRCCCTFCFWFFLILLILLLLIGVAGTAFYLIYHPHRPTFTVTSLKLSYLNLTSSSTLNSKFNINITAKNPNKNLIFVYQPISISILSGDVDVGDGTIPTFEHGKKNTTLLKASILSSGEALENDAETELKKNMKSKNGLALKVKLDTKVKAKMGKLKTPNVGIRVSCDGIRVHLPAGKKPVTASTSNVKCEVDVRFKIWKWTV
ncbi:NDR1/HIN1-like protein 13 [Cicer arietinum]|uniref:NDR1/HIN1-like protein 6 n=1 Tax=Cicer arietinum TaxID=3827 RepID=A0A1S2XBN6_CICAR|nr:NDR1/HIN1-like protein 6 [Cicer arietinum]